MRVLTVIVAGLAVAFGTACSSGDGSELRDAPIDSVQITSIDTFPPSYEVNVVAIIPGSSCHRPQPPTVQRSGRTFRVTVQNLFTGDQMCTADLGYRDLSIELPGDFEPGVEYTVIVNKEPPLTFVAE